MKSSLLLFGLMLLSQLSWAQPNTEVYFLEYQQSEDDFKTISLKNLSQNEGYDNQPSWFDNDYILYGRTQNGATEIALQSTVDGSVSIPYQQTSGGEYSPQRLGTEQDDVLAVRLDTTGYQGLYRYDKNGSSAELIPGLRMAYFTVINPKDLVGSVLSDNRLDLVRVDLEKKTVDTLFENSGRSIHLRPNKKAVSYTLVNDDGNHEIFQLDLDSGESFFIAQLPIGIQDYVWLNNDQILIGSGPRLFIYDLFVGGEWKQVADLSGKGIDEITRMAKNPGREQIALVAMPVVSEAELIVQEQLDAYNARDIDAFMATYSDDIALFNFPDQLIGQGKEPMRIQYAGFFEGAPDLHCEIQKRIVLGNRVIDHELVTANGQKFTAVAIYEVENGKIVKVTFIR